MSNMYNVIEGLCDKKGVNVTQMCRDANVPRATITELKKGRTATLSTMNLVKLASYFNVSIDVFLDDEQKKPTPEGGYKDADLIEAILRADEQTKEAFRLFLKLK